MKKKHRVECFLRFVIVFMFRRVSLRNVQTYKERKQKDIFHLSYNSFDLSNDLLWIFYDVIDTPYAYGSK